MQIGRVDINKLRGVADKGAGLGKELVGTLVGNERLQREGQAQQERAAEETKALRKEVEAQRQDALATAAEQRQRVAQKIKDQG